MPLHPYSKPRSTTHPERRSRSRWTRAIALTFLVALALLAAGALPGRALAAEIEGVRFEDSIRADGERLDLHGLALLRYRVFFRAYVGALYLPPGTSGQRVLDDIPKRMTLEYFWSIDGHEFGEAADALLLRNLGREAVAGLRDRLDALHALYRDVKPGDRYSLTYMPGRGLTLRYNGELLGRVEGADFARAYFGIWLGENPIDPTFRDAMLEPLSGSKR